MENLISFIGQPWPWYVAGPAIAFVMFLMLYFGKSFGVSATLRTACSIGGAGKVNDFFNFDWKDQIWNLIFVGGALIGGFIASNFFSDPNPIQLNETVVADLKAFGINDPGAALLPEQIFSWEAVSNGKALVILILSGFLVGFGARYAGGCTSGHAISGLSDLQLPSLIAVIGFFIGGLTMTYFVLPLILKWAL